jgi:Tol biopolymer transport system component
MNSIHKETATMLRLSRFALSLAAAALLAAFLAPVASSWPGTNGVIVFETFIYGGGEERDRGSGIGIAPLGAERSQITHLTSVPADSDPQVSPDGQRVVFVRSSNPESVLDETITTIYLINTDGSGLQAVTDGLHSDEQPAFSASGARVYFTRLNTRQGGGDIYSVRLDGGGLRQITKGMANDRHPRAASRGGLLAFERWFSGPPTHHIFVSRTDGSRLRDLTPKLSSRLQASDPEVSPDGKRIAYSTGDRLLSVRVDGARPRLLIPPRSGLGSDPIYTDPTYAPDGRSLLFSAIASGRSSLRHLDLRTLRRLPNPLIEPHTSVRSPAWLTRTGR